MELVELAKECHLPLDPDCLFEDREELIGSKLTDGETKLGNPALLSGSYDLNILPHFSVPDVFSYFLSNGVAMSVLREYRRSEAYSLMEDGYVADVQALNFKDCDGYFAVKSAVQPRTRPGDPVSGAPFYYPWIILSSVSVDQRSAVLSAFCTCKGGMDGCCRHVFATLLEILDFREDASSKSVTSGPCLWLKRAKTKEAVLVTELQISSTSCTEDKRPSHDLYSPIHRDVTLPKPQSYFQAVKELLPESCGLDTWEERRAPPLPPAPPLRVRTPNRTRQGISEN